MAAVLPEGVTLFWIGLSIGKTILDRIGPFALKSIDFGPFGTSNRSGTTPDQHLQTEIDPVQNWSLAMLQEPSARPQHQH